MSALDTPDPIVDPERLFDGCESLIPMGLAEPSDSCVSS